MYLKFMLCLQDPSLYLLIIGFRSAKLGNQQNTMLKDLVEVSQYFNRI